MDYLISQVPPKDAVLALGVFDGVHLGHQRLITTAKDLAQRCEPLPCPGGAISFWPHPQKLFAPHKPFRQLTTIQEQKEIMSSLGIDYFGYFHFTKSFASLSATEFTRNVLHDALQVKGIVVGFNFRYGAGNEGDATSLEKAGAELGFWVKVVQPVCLNGGVISSTRIRKLIAQGDVDQATELLGRPYFVQGRVVHGRGRGHDLGFPTINLPIPSERVFPASGVYAGRAWISKQSWRPAAIFVGVPMTFEDDNLSIEAHLIDWNQGLYGNQVKLEFLRRIRPIMKFRSPEELKLQIQSDVARVQELW